MIIVVSLSLSNVTLFHLVNYAFYKKLLFLKVNAIIYIITDNQDFRKYDDLIAFLFLTYLVILIASLNLITFFFITNFYFKNFILKSIYKQFNFFNVIIYFIVTIDAIFIILYLIKILYLTFLINVNEFLINYKRAYEGDVFICLFLIILIIFFIFFNYIIKDMFINITFNFFSDNSLFIYSLYEIMLETKFAISTLFKLLSFFLIVTLSALSLILSEFLIKSLIYFKLIKIDYNIFSFFNQRFLIELFYNKYIIRFILKLEEQTIKILNKDLIELLKSYDLKKGLLNLSKSLSSLNTNVITFYILYILIILILYILISYISLKNISILLCIFFDLLNISFNIFSFDISNKISHSHLSIILLI